MADIDRAAAADPAMWAKANPALGTRITLDHVERELAAMDHRSFCAERLGAGDWPDPSLAGGRVISDDAWSACLDAESRMPGRMALAFDVSPDRSRASIVAAGLRKDRKAHVEVIDHRRGVDWVSERVTELARRHTPVAVICDSRGPASSILGDLAYCRPPVTATTTEEYTQACAAFYDAVTSGALAHLGDPDLEAAVGGAVKRPIGDRWGWSRRNSYIDITSLCAASLAVWGATQRPGGTYVRAMSEAFDIDRETPIERVRERLRRDGNQVLAAVAEHLGIDVEELLKP